MSQDLNDDQIRNQALEQAKAKNTKSSFLIACIIVLIYIILFFTKSGGNITVELMPVAVYMIGILYNNVAFRKNMQGTAQFGEIFSNGFKTIALVILFIILWNVIAVYSIPTFKTNEIELTRQAYLAKANTPEAKEELEEALKELSINRVFILAKVKSILTFQFILGIVVNVISAMFLRTKNN